MQVCWVLVFVSFFYYSLGDSTLYVENSQYTSGSNCTINDPCSSIQEAIDVFFAGTTTPYSTKLVIYLSSGEYPASGNSEITIPAWSDIAIQPLNLTESLPIINCNTFFMSAYNLDISSLHIQGCQDFGIQTLATVAVNIINSNFTDMNTAFKFAESSVMFDSVLIDNVETGIEINLQNYNDSTVYLNQLQISNSRNAILIAGNYGSDIRIFQLNNTIIEHVYNGIQIDKYNSVEFTNIQFNDVGNLDDMDEIISTNEYNLYGLQISNTPTLNLNSISFNNCSSFLQTSNETLNYPPTSTYAFNTYNVSTVLLDSISMNYVAYFYPIAYGTLNESLLAAIYIDQSNEVTLRNIETNIVSGGSEYVNNMQTRGIYIINTNKIDANQLSLQRMGEATYSSSSQLQAIEMHADQISLTNSTFIQVGPKFPYSIFSTLFEKESFYLVASNVYVENLNVSNSFALLIRAEYGEINNVISNNNGNTFMLYGEEFFLTDIQIFHANYHAIVLENSYTKIQNSSFTLNRNDPVYVSCNGTVEIMYCNFENNAGGVYGYSYYLLNIENSVFGNNTSNSLEINQNAGQTVVNSVTFESTGIQCDKSSYIITKQPNSIIEIDVTNTCNMLYGTSVVVYISPNSTNNSTNTNCNNTCCPCTSINSALSYYGATYDYFTFILFPGNYSSENNNDKISLSNTTTFIATSGEINFNCDEYCITANENFFIKTNGLPNTTVTFNSINFDSSSTAVSFQGESLSLLEVKINNFGTGINFNGVSLLLNAISFTNLNTAIDATCDSCDSFQISSSYFSDIETPLHLDSNGVFSSFEITYSNFKNFGQLNITLADGVVGHLTNNNFNGPRNSVVAPVVLNHGSWGISNCLFFNCEDQNSISYTGYGNMYDSLYVTNLYGVQYYCGKSAIQFDSDGDISLQNLNFNDTKNPVQISNAGNVTLYFVNFYNNENPIHISSSSGKINLNYVTFENCGESYLLANNENNVERHFIGHIEHTNSSGFVIDTAGDFYITQVEMVQTNTRPFTINALSDVDIEFYIVYVLYQDLILNENGGVIFSNGANLTLSYIQVDGGISTKNGGAIYANNTQVTVDNRSSFTNCNANMGGAIYCENCKYFENEGKYLNNNASLGGSVYISGGSISTTSLTNFTDSSASFGGAIYGIHITDASFRGDFIQNNASQYGGAIYLESDVSIVAAINAGFGGNSAPNGAIISCCGNSSSCSVKVDDGSFVLNNEANVSSQGDDIACVIVDDDYDDTVPVSAPWGIILILLVVVVVIVIVVVLIIGFAYKRKKQRSLNDYKPLINDEA